MPTHPTEPRETPARKRSTWTPEQLEALKQRLAESYERAVRDRQKLAEGRKSPLSLFKLRIG